MRNPWLRLALGAILPWLIVGVAAAQSGDGEFPTDDDVNRIAKNLYCPVCPNTPLDVCETKACQDWRAQIRDQLAAGWTEEQITVYFVEQYGERVLAEPRRQGFTSLVWVLPAIAAVGGGAAAVYVLRAWKATRRGGVASGEEGAAADELSPEVRERIEEALRRIA